MFAVDAQAGDREGIWIESRCGWAVSLGLGA